MNLPQQCKTILFLTNMIDDVQDEHSSEGDETNTRNSAQGTRQRMLNNAPRAERLHNRMESSIGSLEALDDRGLLEGGCSVSNGSSSLQRRSRRPLEMKNRSNRLKERGKEVQFCVLFKASILKLGDRSIQW